MLSQCTYPIAGGISLGVKKLCRAQSLRLELHILCLLLMRLGAASKRPPLFARGRPEEAFPPARGAISRPTRTAFKRAMVYPGPRNDERGLSTKGLHLLARPLAGGKACSQAPHSVVTTAADHCYVADLNNPFDP